MGLRTVTKFAGQVDSAEGLPIQYDLFTPDIGKGEKWPVIIFLHGFKGFKDWGPFPAVRQELSSLGFGVLGMNFSLNGVGSNMTKFDQLDLFARETLSQDLDDVGSIIAALRSGDIESGEIKLDTNDIGLLGHSRGGHTAVAASAEYSEVSCLVTWSAVADYNAHWSKEMIQDWESRGVTEIKNSRTGQVMPVKKVVYEDALKNADRLIALNRVSEIDLPALFVHAEGDEAVPYTEAEKLYEHCSSQKKELKLIPDSGHTFGGGHPHEKDELPKSLDNVLAITGKWFRHHLQ